jgi:hypothetical protein
MSESDRREWLAAGAPNYPLRDVRVLAWKIHECPPDIDCICWGPTKRDVERATAILDEAERLRQQEWGKR